MTAPLQARDVPRLTDRESVRPETVCAAPATIPDPGGLSRKRAARRELIDTGTDKRYVRRDAQRRFKESDNVGRSFSADRCAKTKTKATSGDG